MSDESPRKKPRLSENDTDSLSKSDLLDLLKKQEDYITELETKIDLSGPSCSSAGDGEDKSRSLKAARREQLLVMRLTTKEQELHELANQLASKTQNASTSALRSALVDPALNLLIQRLKRELDDKNKALQQAQEDMAAWKFTPDSQTGKRLMARCRTLFQENQELGKQVSQGKVAQLEAELAVQKEINEELKNSQDEMYEMVIQLNDEGEGMQSTIVALQQELKDKQQDITRLTYAGENNDTIPNPAAKDLPESSEPAKEEVQNEMEMDHDGQPDMQSNSMPSDMQRDFSEAVNPQEPYPEPMEQGDATTEQEREEPQAPAVRTTQYNQEVASPVRSMNEDVQDDISANNNFSRDNVSAEQGMIQPPFAESPASPVRVEDDQRTSEGPQLADVEFRTAEADADIKREATGADFRTDVDADESSDATLEEQAIGEEKELDINRDGDSPERTTEPSMQEERKEAAVSDDRYGTQEGSRDLREIQDVAEVYYLREKSQFRTPDDESSQDSALSGGARDVDSDDSSRTGQRSDSLTPEISTNGESHSEAAPYAAAANNGEVQPCVNNDNGREGVSVERSNENVSNTLVEDRSTFETIGGEGESNSLDNGSNVTDNRSHEVVPDNNGLCSPGEGMNSGLSSPLEDEVPPSDGEVTRTDNPIKSLHSNSHEESPQGPESEQCAGEQDTVDKNSVPSTNSNVEEISV